MNIVVFGLGSMGKRRIRLIKKYNRKYNIMGIDLNTERRQYCEKEYSIKTYISLQELQMTQKVDCAFVCTAPLSHYSIITECLEQGLHVFSELNLVSDDYDKNIALANKNKRVLFLSSTLLYRKEIQRIKKLIKDSNCKFNYTYHVGQYLPDWHPWESYENFFVNNKRTNGCREIFAIELPWIVSVFGKIQKVEVLKSKISNLNIDYPDNYITLFEHDNGNKGVLAVDVVSRKPVRNLEVFGEKLYLQWDGSGEGLKLYDICSKRDKKINLYAEINQLKEYSNFVVENAYYDEIESFFNAIFVGEQPLYNFSKDKKILKLIDDIEV